MNTKKDYIYYPILKWRMGEYQALFRLDKKVKDHVRPVLEVCPVEWDFELRKDAKTIDEHLEKFASRLKDKWGERKAYLDMNLIPSATRMANKDHPLKFLGDNCRTYGCSIIPIITLDSDLDFVSSAARHAQMDGRGLCLRVTLDDLADENFDEDITDIIVRTDQSIKQIDIIIDLKAPDFDPISDFSSIVIELIKESKILPDFRNIIIAGTSFPETMASIQSGEQIIPRHEWAVFKEIQKQLPFSISFGDYSIAHPSLVSGDMRILKPSATIRYTIDNAWYVAKGRNVRDYGFGQYRNQCESIVKGQHYKGAAYSKADKFMEDCALNGGSTGNLTTWRWVGTNHHITKIVHDLSNFSGT